MSRDETITALKARVDDLRAMGATSLYLFGSVARDDPSAKDVDLFIDYSRARPFTLIDLVGIQQYLETALAADVDLTTRDSLHPMLRDDIERSAIQVF